MNFKGISQFSLSLVMISFIASPLFVFAAEPEQDPSSLAAYAENLEKKSVAIPQINWPKIESPSELAKVRLQSFRLPRWRSILRVIFN